MEKAKAIDLSVVFLETARKYKKVALSNPDVFAQITFSPDITTFSTIYVFSYSEERGEATVFCENASNKLKDYLRPYGKLDGVYRVFLHELPKNEFSEPSLMRPLSLSKRLLSDHSDHLVA
ncbi:hypothetical protein A9Q91_02605 [Candidatus Gracilibacteria bacterium 28_42_T64]|nr:hypothetical protein A9Q91_02605 [Candidatus Gracilibacteria bacterium 28_42_T64]